MWLDLAIALSCAGGGLICGWIMHAIGGFGNYRIVKSAAASIVDRDGAEEPSPKRISEVAGRLRDYAIAMAADVDAHQTRVQEVNNSLSDDNATSPDTVFDAVNQLIEANEQMQAQLQSAQDQIHEQAVQIESAERRAQTDALTRVPNRGAFDDHFRKQHALGPGKAGTLALLDVDHFKRFNDVYGHRAGDEVLRIVAKVLQSRLQPHGLVARFGGEEFAVILDGCPIDQAKELVESARIAIGQRDIPFEDKRLRVAASIGVAELTGDETIETWLQRADDAMYRSKEAGRDCGHWMDGEHPIRIQPQPASPQQPELQSPEEAQEEVSAATDAVPQKTGPGALASLPDRSSLGDSFVEMQSKTPGISMFVMSVRLGGQPDQATMRSLLQIVRATMRSVDRIGWEDESTLLVCMPSVDEETAQQRGQQICRSADAIRLGGGTQQPYQVTIGLMPADDEENFDEIVSCATRLALEAAEEGTTPIRLQQGNMAGV